MAETIGYCHCFWMDAFGEPNYPFYPAALCGFQPDQFTIAYSFIPGSFATKADQVSIRVLLG